jgi:hypothetical protein
MQPSAMIMRFNGDPAALIMPVGGHTGTNALLFGSLSGARYAAYTGDDDGGKQAGRRRGAVKKGAVGEPTHQDLDQVQ